MRSKLTIVLLISTFCVFAQKRKKKEYKEDLTKVEPTYEYNLDSLLISSDSIEENFITTYDVTPKLDSILDSITRLNLNIKYIKGYKVLAYSGSSQPDALEIRKEILQAFSNHEDFKDEKVDFVWHQPTYRVYIGEYQNRLPAVRMSEFLKSYSFQFSNENVEIQPLVVPSNLQIRE